MPDLREEYPHLLKAYEEMRTHTDIKQQFETEWNEVMSVAEEAKKKSAQAAAPIKELETLLPSLSEAFSKEPEAKSVAARKLLEKMPAAKGDAPHGLKKMPAAFAPEAEGFCRSCGYKLSPDAAFCKNCGAKVG